jgi:hypothetical protein
VFLKYYHVEYLSKLYEDQVSHIFWAISWMIDGVDPDWLVHITRPYINTIADCEAPS